MSSIIALSGDVKAMALKDVDYYVDGVLARNRLILSRTITIVESSLAAHQERAREIMERLLPYTGNAVRIGITGVPGAGKSTFIESFGMMLLKKGLAIAVLAVDPSSKKSGGSIMADKTRMEKLSAEPRSYIRPSPTGHTLGGVAQKTREALLICEAAGFDVVIVETVGVGQLETTVASMVDFFLVLMIPGAGDELQGIKRGILELADAIVINKADGDNISRAQLAKREYETALHLVNPASPNWSPPVLTCSALAEEGIEEIWGTIQDHRRTLGASGEIEARRREQALEWTWFLIDEGLHDWFYKNPRIAEMLPGMKRKIEAGLITPTQAAQDLLSVLLNRGEEEIPLQREGNV